MTIEFVINLWNNKTNNNGLLTVGGPDVKNVDSVVPNPTVHYRNEFQRNQKTLYSFLRTGNKDLQAVAVLYNQKPLPEFIISSKQPFIVISNELKKIIQDNLVDLIVYGRRAAVDSCELFLDLYPQYATRKYTLREIDDRSRNRDNSLNRCTITTDAFAPEKFKLGKLTPGEENDCSGTHFILEEHLVSITSPLQKESYDIADTEVNEASLLDDNTAQCTSSQSTSMYMSSTIGKISDVIEKRFSEDQANECVQLDLDSDGATTINELNIDNNRKRRISDTMDYSEEFEWETTKHFHENWLELIKTNQDNLIPVKHVIKNKDWFEYLPNIENPAESHYRCRLCHTYYDKFSLDKKYKNALANEEGALYNTLDRNREIIIGHGSIKGHLSVIEILKSQKKKRMRMDFENIREREENEDERILEITSKMLRTVYVLNKLTMPFSSHTGLVTLQELNRIDMGYHHYDRSGCTRMTEFISETMHNTMIDTLLNKNVPISIIVDGTTDSSRIHYLIVYFQTIENDNPVIYFYRLLEVNDESALGLFTIITQAWEKEKGDFVNYMKRNLIGFASDGASVNLGRSGGLVQHFKNFANSPIFAVHCMAHRLELAIQHSFEIDDLFVSTVGRKIESYINSVYSFYNEKTHKRKTHLKSTADRIYKNTNKKRYYELIYIFQVRWIASNYKAMNIIYNMFEAIVIDLTEISEDRTFPAATREKAATMKKTGIGKNFLILFHFLFDIVHELDFWSLQLQKRSGVLIDFHNFKTQLTGAFHIMETMDSRHLNGFLREVKCVVNGIENRCMTTDKYEASNTVIYHGSELLDDGNDFPRLTAFREIYLGNLLEELESYFPDGDLEDFNILSPHRMPKVNDEAATRSYGLNEIRNLAEYFKLEETAIINEWQTLLQSIVKSSKYCTIKRDEAEAVDFWAALLSWGDIAWGDNIKKLVQTVLAIPISSAEAERGFSVLNYLRNDRRKTLSGAHLDDILNIKLNGPSDLNKFVATKYARAWLNAGKMRTDDPSGRRKATLDVDANAENKKYSLLRSTIF